MADDKNTYSLRERERRGQTRYKVLAEKYIEVRAKKLMSQFIQKAPHDRTHNYKYTYAWIDIYTPYLNYCVCSFCFH